MKNESMRTIIERFNSKVQKNDDDSFIYLYGGGQINLDLTFEEQANQIDRKSDKMKILVYKTEDDGFKCTYCGKKIKLDEDLVDIIKAYNNLKETINSIKVMIDNIIKTSTNNLINGQLKIIDMTLNTVKEDIKKNNEKLEKIFNNNDNDEFKDKNTTKGTIENNSNDKNMESLNEKKQEKGKELYVKDSNEKKKWKM